MADPRIVPENESPRPAARPPPGPGAGSGLPSSRARVVGELVKRPYKAGETHEEKVRAWGHHADHLYNWTLEGAETNEEVGVRTSLLVASFVEALDLTVHGIPDNLGPNLDYPNAQN